MSHPLPKNSKAYLCSLGLGLALAISGTPGFAQAQETAFEPFSAFMAHTQQASARAFLGHTDPTLDALVRARNQAAAPVTFKVRDEAAFEEMRQAVLDRYQGVQVTHSFVLDNQHYDCVPLQQQPAVRKFHLTEIAKPPVLARPAGSAEASPVPEQPEQQFDKFGNSTRCEANTTALHRLTLETLSRFATLHDFYKKSPPLQTGSSQSAALLQANTQSSAEPVDKYSVFDQSVTNISANATFNIWQPTVDVSAGQIFSAMELVDASVAENQTVTATEETGWAVYPALFGDELSRFFIYSTADNSQTTGSYNNAAGDFVQIADSGVLGSTFSGTSSPGGAQHEFSAQYRRDSNNNWWLFRGGVAVGYYPAAFYRNDPTTRNFLEVATATASTGNWPAAGSGDWAAALYGYAAYARQLFYSAPDESTHWNDYHLFANSSCYNYAGPFDTERQGNVPSSTPDPSWWTEYLFVGGPGGAGCS